MGSSLFRFVCEQETPFDTIPNDVISVVPNWNCKRRLNENDDSKTSIWFSNLICYCCFSPKRRRRTWKTLSLENEIKHPSSIDFSVISDFFPRINKKVNMSRSQKKTASFFFLSSTMSHASKSLSDGDRCGWWNHFSSTRTMEGDSTRNSCILTLLGDESLRKLTDELIAFFKDPNASTNTLLTLIKDHCPSSSVVEGIIALYSAAKLRPTLCKYLNQVVKVLKLHQQQQQAEFPLDAEITSDLLHHAVSKDYEYLFQLLIQAGVSPNALSKDQKTPLSIAVVCHQFNPMKRLEYVQRLLVNGADAMITDVKGDSSFKRLCGMGS